MDTQREKPCGSPDRTEARTRSDREWVTWLATLRTIPELQQAWDTIQGAHRTPELLACFQDAAGKRKRVDSAKKQLAEAVGPRLAGCRLSNFICEHPPQFRVVAKLTSYLAEMPRHLATGANLILRGTCGTGKDHLCIGLAFCAIEDYQIGVNVPIAWCHGASLWADLRGTIGSRQAMTEEKIIRRLIQSPVVILSDPIMAGKPLSAYQAETLSRVIDARWRNQRPTWLTINVASGEEADSLLGAANVDRLRDGALILECEWPSYRKPL
jgi:DNA replication protein DnaC